MNELLPIIRRKRRPLIVADAPPVVVGNVEPVQAVATKPVETIESEKRPEKNDAQFTSHRSAR